MRVNGWCSCDAFVTMFDHLLNPNFDVASDAFDSFKVCESSSILEDESPLGVVLIECCLRVGVVNTHQQ